jgi:ER membrane protein complex subunit 3
MQTAFQKGEYLKDPENRGQPPANPLTDPGGMDQMMNMMKGNMVMFIPQTVIMGWINFFFSGFVLRILFPKCGLMDSQITVSVDDSV